MQDSPSTAEAPRGVSDDVHNLPHRFPALPFGWAVANDHTFDIHHRGVCVEFGEPCLERGHEPLFWCMGRLCDQASRTLLPPRGVLTFSQHVRLDHSARRMLRSAARLHDSDEFPQWCRTLDRARNRG